MLSQRKLSKIAKIYAANLVRNALCGGCHSELITEDDKQLLDDELQIIADRISKDQLATLDEIIQKVKNSK